MKNDTIVTDLCIIGAGPVGLFSVFEAGLLKMRCHLIDVLPQVGGQLSEIYPQKPIYDIPGFPVIKAQELIDNLIEQIRPFNPTFSLGELVKEIYKLDENTFRIKTSENTIVEAKAIVIAGGLGCFEPRKPSIENLSQFEGKGISYFVKNIEQYRDKRIVIAGGGDSALDWTIELSKIAKKVTLIHRNNSFRGSPDSADKIFKMAESGEIDLVLGTTLNKVDGDTKLQKVYITNNQGFTDELSADALIPLFGLTPKLGPIADWGLNLESNAIAVNTLDYSTNEPGIYAIGDINTYPGKLKLILCGFHEAALMAQGAFKRVFPDEKLTFKYTTVYGVNSF
ncbi:NAD(P)/FAD-dependent oxidoreductase [Sphingobacterium rhinopitheci]|uniref:NAD(P)/FAD-dependent oxidoreductase n=1 Tax=Sphingobacterium rhinopitheci TaxID=2781960 RepID=UPI001F52A6AA|nr:NAD(P)/FAD-dependent oxidoreductase [Sphingobacterium rhinopitheci]MCI0922692.1 NAD(P)/FAD-dependent oxidoreductase [Sphingobacterium rhinopitheci]